MKKFFNEFKKFIARGNIVDMAVGVIVGSSFTAIVNALSNNILKPIINYFLALILGKDALSELYTFLKLARPADDPSGIDLENSIYIDWGAFIMAIINFLIVAFVLFCIVKTINSMRENTEEYKKRKKKEKLSKEDRKILKSRGIKRSNKKAVRLYLEEKAKAEAKAKEKAEAEAKAKAEAEKLAKASTDELLRAILEEMKKKKKKK